MTTPLRIATFNLENLDDKPGTRPTLSERIAVLRPQLVRLRADILCLQEVNGQEHPGEPRGLAALTALLAETPYAAYQRATTATSGGEVYDERNLVVLSRLPISSRRQIKHELAPKPRYRTVTAQPAETEAADVTWERPILYVTIDLGGSRTLHLINLHLKSMLPVDITGQKIDRNTWKTVAGWAEGAFLATMKRVGQAMETRILIDSIFDRAEAAGQSPLVAVCGDFNADSDSVAVGTIRGQVEETGNPALGRRIMVPCELSVPESARFSLIHRGKGAMLDHLLASRALLQLYRSTEIHNETLHDESGAFGTDSMFPESDHAPVVAEFMLP